MIQKLAIPVDRSAESYIDYTLEQGVTVANHRGASRYIFKTMN